MTGLKPPAASPPERYLYFALPYMPSATATKAEGAELVTMVTVLRRYEFMYKQAVESTDVFLGIGGKDESSQSCEDLVVKVLLPEVTAISGEQCDEGRDRLLDLRTSVCPT
jgi:hypothetical protein